MNISAEEKRHIIELIHRRVVPAVGCTEPICVALAAARMAELLAEKPVRVEVLLSANILKNAMGVGIPGTGMTGLPIAVALGIEVGKSEWGLEVLKGVTPEAVETARQFIAEGRIDIRLKEDCEEKLYVEIHGYGDDNHHAVVAIAREHTNYILQQRDGEVLLQKSLKREESAVEEEPGLTMAKVYEFATTMPLEEIAFIDEARTLNMKVADESLHKNYGHRLGKTLTRPIGRGILGDSIFAHILSSTSCACDARMAGAMTPVMSNSGSGNQGICATNPVAVFADENHNTDEERIRALMLSHLTAIYIKQHLGALSALCGCIVAATGSSCGITYLMGGDYQQVCFAVKNMIANLTGMICDGAKPSCTLKLASGVSTAILSAMLAMQNETVQSTEGIIDDDVDQSIRNLVSIGKESMNETDRCVLNIMTHKKKRDN